MSKNTTVSAVAATLTASTESAAKLAADAAKTAAKKALEARRAPQTPQSLLVTFPDLNDLLDKVIVNKFVGLGIVDGNMWLDAEGNGTNDEEAGVESNPNFMKVVADGRTAWRSLTVVNEELFAITNGIWDARAKEGSLAIPGYNDSREAVHGYKKFTVTEAGALAALLFGTRDNRTTGLFFRHFVCQEIQAQHRSYMGTPEARKVAEEAKARRARIEAAKERRAAAAEEQANYEQYQASVPEVSTPVISADAGLKVAKDGSLRQNGRFVKKNQVLDSNS